MNHVDFTNNVMDLIPVQPDVFIGFPIYHTKFPNKKDLHITALIPMRGRPVYPAKSLFDMYTSARLGCAITLIFFFHPQARSSWTIYRSLRWVRFYPVHRRKCL